MRLSGSRAYYRSTPPKMPPGLVELIEGLTREVLKNNPSDIYGFCAGHVQQLLEIRDRPLQKKTLTLEEKIAKAQEKVRKRAEQRRNKYNNDVLNQPSGKEPEIRTSSINKDNTPLIQPQESTAVNVQEKPVQNDLDLDSKTEAETSYELDKASEGPQNQEIKDVQDHDEIKHEIKSLNLKSEDKKWKSQSKTNLAELPNEAIDSIITLASDLNESPNTDTESKIEMLDHSRAPSTDGLITNAEVLCLKENQECVADAGDKHEPAGVTSNSEEKLSSSIDCVTTNQNYELVTDENVSNVLSKVDKTVELGDQNSPTSEINVIPNENTETLSDNITVPLNKIDNQSSNHTMSNQNFIDSDVTDQSNIGNVELTADSVDTVKNKVDLQETKTFDISFKESPTVELQDSQINPEMLESILERNTDSDIVTLLTQDSTNAELNSTSVDLQQNGLKNTPANAETPEVYKGNSDTNGIISIHEELQDNIGSKNVINSFDLIENINKENEHNKIDNNCDENSSKKLGEDTQIHHQDGNMDLETAAVTIQKVFRTFLFKSRASTFDDTVNDETIFMNEADKNKEECGFTITSSLNERRSHGITRMDTVLQTVNEEKSLSLSTDDSSTISSAASVIQAHVRGFLVRNKLNSNKTVSTNSLAATNSKEPSLTSLEMENEQNKNKTILNIHIVPEGGNYLSRDESLITSMDLSLDSSPPSSINLHPLGYDKSERRKQLKREDAIQSISPPSNNSGKLSEDVDSVKELPLNDNEITEEHDADNNGKDSMDEGTNIDESEKKPDASTITLEKTISDNVEKLSTQKDTEEKINSDEMDVVTPFISNGDNNSSDKNLMHSGEFHDAVLPTKVSRSDTTVASEFKNVLVYFLLWNHS